MSRPRRGRDDRREANEMRCRIREQIIESGQYAELKIYPVYGEAPKGGRRRRFRPTAEAQQRLNDWNSARHLAHLIEANFTEEDLWIHPTFRNEELPADDEAFKRLFRNFVRRLGRAYKKLGVALKYVAVLERSDAGRYHIHMIVNKGLTPDVIRDIWGLGRLSADPLEFTEYGLKGLADYMSKYRQITRRFLSSRNLTQPETRERDGRHSQREVRALARNPEDRAQWEALQPGYTFLDCRTFYNDVNGGVYICVRFWKPPRNKRRNSIC